MNNLLRGLNDPQRQAVTHGDGPLLILAGAGSGKTRTLIHRVAWLIEERGVPPWQILAVTFTNKAAGEMKERLERLLGGGELPWVATFHATCVRILRQEIAALGYSRDFTIYDDQDQKRLLKDLLAERGISEKTLRPNALAAAIDRAKNNGLLPGQLPAGGYLEELIDDLYALYQQRLQQANAVDFGDLLLLTVRLFSEHPEVLERWRQRFHYLLVDEFQDTNGVQYRLVDLLAREHRNLCVVGDDDQSIYAWRGAEIGNILGFERDYPGTVTIRLEQNYRSTGTILEAAGEVVSRNVDRKGKTLWTENDAGEPLVLEALPDDLEEARFVARQIGQLRGDGLHLRDMAVFYRTNAQSRVLEEALVRERIPYAMFGGLKFFARMEIKDVLAYLRVLVNPADSVSAKRIINVPPRGIGKTTVGRIEPFEAEAGGFLPACRLALERGGLGGAAARRVRAFVEMMDSFARRLERLPYPQLTAELIEETGYGPALREEKTREAKERLQNLEELLKGMEEHRGSEAGLGDYLEQVALVTDLDSYDRSLDRVTLMTLHAAKGLEFPVVFMTGMEEGLFPHSRSGDEEDVEEERRLCYVGMTRAMRRLFLTHARRRRVFGSYQYNARSRFLDEIPLRLLAQPADSGLRRPAEHNLASVFSQVPQAPEIEEPETGFEEVRLVPEAEEGLRIGLRVRHVKFGLGTVRRIEGRGDNQKVIVFFNTVGAKKLLLKFAGLEPA
ncbi:ATP-dependent helicase [Geothermobacter hydrogeniphilus]|uniref:DNA 3'-5' helicase n=1 Tax=Geothermobacter hydrogeniphilus TaxID=1969733 RepID=A0A1X0XQ16_9BACT|nr:UvrD-helicase domain-containing protein [Geothermobacter hydrogeniphilus]ORJ54973.1 ATP-dependent DNA helicase PcrA [Geothermobacter hydrogeniphilus]